MTHLQPSRRTVIGAGVAGGLAAIATTIYAAARSEAPPPHKPIPHDDVEFFGQHQCGIAIPPQAHSVYLAFDLTVGCTRGEIIRMLRLITSSAERLVRGIPALADTEPELAANPARLTVLVGFGAAIFAGAGVRAPAWLQPLPSFQIDRLDQQWCDGDLLVEIAADDPTQVAHTQRMLLKDIRTFAQLRWIQKGFRDGNGTKPRGATMRNLFGQLDGSANPPIGSPEFEQAVWITHGELAGGTSMIIRRISMDLEGWDKVSRVGREHAIGRALDTGAPLTGTHEHDEPDLDAQDEWGFPVIPIASHLRRARFQHPAERFYRRGANYDQAPSMGGMSDSGLIFTTFQADPLQQFVPVQQRLAEMDVLNTWTTPIGSAVFAIPPGCEPGEYLGQRVLES